MRSKSLVLGLLLIAALTISLLKWDMTDSNNGSGVQMEKPSLVALAATDGQEQKGVNFLQQEAGISAYVKVDQAIDLEQVRGAFKTVETVSDEYIIGEVALPGLPEKVHPHVYVNKDGWIVAYYSKDEPASKIMQWVGYKGGPITTTTLEDAIRKLYDSLRLPYLEDVKYYNFEYPNANRIMLITETTGWKGQDQFYLKIPTGCRLLEASWTHYVSCSARVNLRVDGTLLDRLDGPAMRYGELTNQLRVNVRHDVSLAYEKLLRACGRDDIHGAAIVLIYEV